MLAGGGHGDDSPAIAAFALGEARLFGLPQLGGAARVVAGEAAHGIEGDLALGAPFGIGLDQRFRCFLCPVRGIGLHALARRQLCVEFPHQAQVVGLERMPHAAVAVLFRQGAAGEQPGEQRVAGTGQVARGAIEGRAFPLGAQVAQGQAGAQAQTLGFGIAFHQQAGLLQYAAPVARLAQLVQKVLAHAIGQRGVGMLIDEGLHGLDRRVVALELPVTQIRREQVILGEFVGDGGEAVHAPLGIGLARRDEILFRRGQRRPRQRGQQTSQCEFFQHAQNRHLF